MEHRLRLSSEEAVRGYKKRLAQAERRLGELDRLFIRIYEDNVAGKLSDERFTLMSKTYEDEQAQLKVEIQTLQQEIEVQERQIENLEQFIQRIHKYEDLQEMTPYALRELVKGIYIEAPDKSSGKRPLRSRRYSTTPIRLSLSRKSLTRCRKSASSATEGQKPARAACSPAWFTVLIAGQKCATAPPTTLRSGKTILYAPATAATREPVQLTSSGRLYWKNWSGCT